MLWQVLAHKIIRVNGFLIADVMAGHCDNRRAQDGLRRGWSVAQRKVRGRGGAVPPPDIDQDLGILKIWA